MNGYHRMTLIKVLADNFDFEFSPAWTTSEVHGHLRKSGVNDDNIHNYINPPIVSATSTVDDLEPVIANSEPIEPTSAGSHNGRARYGYLRTHHITQFFYEHHIRQLHGKPQTDAQNYTLWHISGRPFPRSIEAPTNSAKNALYELMHSHKNVLLYGNPGENQPSRFYLDIDKPDSSPGIQPGDLSRWLVPALDLFQSRFHCGRFHFFKRADKENYHIVSEHGFTVPAGTTGRDCRRWLAAQFMRALREVSKDRPVPRSFFNCLDMGAMGTRLAGSFKEKASKILENQYQLITDPLRNSGVSRSEFTLAPRSVEATRLSDPSYFTETFALEAWSHDIIKYNADRMRNYRQIELIPESELSRATRLKAVKQIRPRQLNYGNTYRQLLQAVKGLFISQDTEFNSELISIFDGLCQKARNYDRQGNAHDYETMPGLDDPLGVIRSFSRGEKMAKYMKKHIEAPAVQPEFTADQTIDQKYIGADGSAPDFSQSIFLRSALGTGKTTALMQYLKNYTGRFLIISHRITLIRKLKADMDEHGIECDLYDDPAPARSGGLESSDDSDDIFDILEEDAPDESVAARNMITTVESLHKMRGEFDTVIIDEFSQMIGQLCSSTIRAPIELERTITRIFASEPALIAMDGMLTDSYIDIFTEAFPAYKQAQRVLNTHKNKKGQTMFFHEDLAVFDACLYRAIDEGKNIVVACDQRVDIQTYATMLEKKVPGQVLTIHGRTDAAIRQEFADILADPRQIEHYRAFLYSPAIESGVSINHPHFHQQFNRFCHPAHNFVSAMQMTNRVRQLHDNEQHLFIRKRCTALTPEEELNRMRARARVPDASDKPDGFASVVRHSINPADIPLLKMVARIRSLHSEETVSFFGLAVEFAKDAGYETVFYPAIEHEAVDMVKNEMKEAKSESKETNRQQLAQADAHYVERPITAAESNSKFKYRFMQATGFDESKTRMVLANKNISKDALTTLERRNDIYRHGLDNFIERKEVIPDPRNRLLITGMQDRLTRQHYEAAREILKKLGGALPDKSTPSIQRSSLDWSLEVDTEHLRLLFGLRRKPEKINMAKNFRASLAFVNNILMRCFGCKLKAKNTKRQEYVWWFTYEITPDERMNMLRTQYPELYE